MSIKLKYLFVSTLAVTYLSGCSSLSDLNDTFAGRKVDYEKQSREINRLEVPPSIVSQPTDDMMVVPEVRAVEDSADYSEYAKASNRGRVPLSQQVLPEQKDIELIKEKDIRHLRIIGTKEQVWNKMREYWLNRGMLIKRESPTTGILETEWAENRADIPQDVIRSALSTVFAGFYSAATRDKYRVRIEDGEVPGTVDLYVTHYGMQEVIESESTERTIWVTRPRDSELEAEMLGSMMVFFGVEEERAKALLARNEKAKADKTVLARNDQGISRLLIKETFPRAWRRTGVALDRINFVVEDRDRSQGLYYVQYADPLKEETKTGFFSKLKFWGDDSDAKDKEKFQIKLFARDEQTIATVLTDKGEPDDSTTAYRILTLLHEQLK